MTGLHPATTGIAKRLRNVRDERQAQEPGSWMVLALSPSSPLPTFACPTPSCLNE